MMGDGDQPVIGHGLSSHTAQIKMYRLKFDSKNVEANVVLVDTPGFDDSDVNDTVILQRIADWLTATYGISSAYELSSRGLPRSWR